MLVRQVYDAFNNAVKNIKWQRFGKMPLKRRMPYLRSSDGWPRSPSGGRQRGALSGLICEKDGEGDTHRQPLRKAVGLTKSEQLLAFVVFSYTAGIVHLARTEVLENNSLRAVWRRALNAPRVMNVQEMGSGATRGGASPAG